MLMVLGLLAVPGLTGCGGGGGVPAAGRAPQQPYLPVAGVGADSGLHPLSAGAATPSAQEAELLKLINEVRTLGTLGGKSVIAGSCAETSFAPRRLAPLTYSGVLAQAASKHAQYMGQVGYQGHDESAELAAGSSFFYGASRQDRVQRSVTEAGLSPTYDFVASNSGENVAGGTPGQTDDGGMTTGYATPREVMEAWIKSPAHCRNLMNPAWDFVGTAYHQRAEPNVHVQPRLHQHSWVQVFGRGTA
ncbi:MAG: CAP domain-containing protein [Deinococcus sp.]|nr:CAP domain-containing protein [Deinococcus sp.]